MNIRANQIGFSQRIRLEWLKYTANLILAGNNHEAVQKALKHLLEQKLSVGGAAQRGNREKAITILMKIWANVPSGLERLRDKGLILLRDTPQEQQIAVHWGMTMAVYPFWGAVAVNVGRLLRLQGTAAALHIQRRVREQYGERDTVSRAARRVIRTFVDWKVLAETDSKGLYRQGLSIRIDEPELVAWLIEAALRARPSGALPLRTLLDSPSLFPFRLKHVSTDRLAASLEEVEFLRHGLDEDVIMLKEPRVAPRGFLQG